MEQFEQKSIWDKTEAELTTGDQFKIAAVSTVAVTAGMVAIWGAVTGCAAAWEKFKARKAEKAREENQK